MRTNVRLIALASLGLGALLGWLAASGHLQQLAHAWAETPSKSATTESNGGSLVLPRPEEPFRGKIGLRPSESVKDSPATSAAPATAWSSPGPSGSRTPARSAASSTT